MGLALHWLGERLVRFLSRDRHIHSTAVATPPGRLRATLKVGDVLLVEGGSRISTIIKFLTQSTWSHAALYVVDQMRNIPGRNADH
jgi:hypothetical protein